MNNNGKGISLEKKELNDVQKLGNHKVQWVLKKVTAHLLYQERDRPNHLPMFAKWNFKLPIQLLNF